MNGITRMNRTVSAQTASTAFTARFAALVFPLAALACFSGCTLGFRNMHPDEESGIYTSLFEDIITNFDTPEWLWTRGTIVGDFDADGKAEEEAVIATIQAGDHRNPGPILEAYLVVCKIQPDGRRVAIARTKLFELNPIPDAERIRNNANTPEVEPMRYVRAQIFGDKLRLGDSIVVYFWGDARPSNVWLGGYKLINGELVKTLDAATKQRTPGLTNANLDKRVGSEATGFQLIIPSASIPDEIADKMGDDFNFPMWGHVFVKDKNDRYHQADVEFGEHYNRIENAWNQAYIQATMVKHLDAADPAWFEYHLGMLNHFLNKEDLAKSFLAKAEAGATDAQLIAAVKEAIALLPQE